MKCLEFDSLRAAVKRSSDEALKQGCGPVTSLWWGTYERDGKMYLIVDNETGLTDEEKLNIVELEDTENDTIS